jgi:hypothetical protein
MSSFKAWLEFFKTAAGGVGVPGGIGATARAVGCTCGPGGLAGCGCAAVPHPTIKRRRESQWVRMETSFLMAGDDR